jgi:DNA-binding GntR family transcriptional regulator
MKSNDLRRAAEATDEKPPLSLLVEQDPISLREKTVAKLREAIIAGYFKPGEQLVERDICSKMEVSRTSLREALRHLETEGVVESRKSEGVFVQHLTPDDVRDIYEVRMALDAEAARHFSERASGKYRARLKSLSVQWTKVAYDDFDRTLRMNNEFFEVLHEGGGNKLSLAIMRSLQTRISLLRAITQRSSNQQRHLQRMTEVREIAAEIRRGNSRKAAQLCRQYAANSLEFALAVISQTEPEAQPQRLRPLVRRPVR